MRKISLQIQSVLYRNEKDRVFAAFESLVNAVRVAGDSGLSATA